MQTSGTSGAFTDYCRSSPASRYCAVGDVPAGLGDEPGREGVGQPPRRRLRRGAVYLRVEIDRRVVWGVGGREPPELVVVVRAEDEVVETQGEWTVVGDKDILRRGAEIQPVGAEAIETHREAAGVMSLAGKEGAVDRDQTNAVEALQPGDLGVRAAAPLVRRADAASVEQLG